MVSLVKAPMPLWKTAGEQHQPRNPTFALHDRVRLWPESFSCWVKDVRDQSFSGLAVEGLMFA